MSRGQLAQRFEFRDCVLSKHSGLTPTVKLVLLALDSFRSPQSPMPFPSIRALTEVTGFSDKGVRNALMQAAVLGWIDKQHRHKDNGSQTTDLYILHVPESVLDAVRGSTSYQPPLNVVPAPLVPRTDESLYLNPCSESKGASGKNALAPFLDAYNASEGFIAPGRLGKALRPLLAAKGHHEALRAFTGWLKSPDVRFGPEYFVSHYAQYDLPPATDENGMPNADVLLRLGIRV